MAIVVIHSLPGTLATTSNYGNLLGKATPEIPSGPQWTRRAHLALLTKPSRLCMRAVPCQLAGLCSPGP
ncbi:unnamed protein product [Lampetra fluviatilis]